MSNDVDQRVLKVVAEVLNRKENEIPLNASLRNDLAATSIDRMTLFIALEDEFQRSIPPEQIAGIDTVRDIIQFINGKLKETASS
jgi:acyl carrier protein